MMKVAFRLILKVKSHLRSFVRSFSEERGEKKLRWKKMIRDGNLKTSKTSVCVEKKEENRRPKNDADI